MIQIGFLGGRLTQSCRIFSSRDIANFNADVVSTIFKRRRKTVMVKMCNIHRVDMLTGLLMLEIELRQCSDFPVLFIAEI